MSVLKVIYMGHPTLRKVAEKVSPEELSSPETQRLIDDMIETMFDYDGAGLAAPQVNRSLRIIVVGVEENERYPDAEDIPLTVLVNPVFEELSEEIEEGWEGCISLKDLRGKVFRHLSVTVKALDRYGETVEFTAENFFARALQHEMDHLDGIVFPERMDDLTSFSFEREQTRYLL